MDNIHTDPTLTVKNVCEVMSLVSETDWKRVWRWGLLLFDFQIDSNAHYVASTLEGHQVCAEDYINCSPKASWQYLSRILYQMEETIALNKVKQFLPPRGICTHEHAYMYA